MKLKLRDATTLHVICKKLHRTVLDRDNVCIYTHSEIELFYYHKGHDAINLHIFLQQHNIFNTHSTIHRDISQINSKHFGSLIVLQHPHPAPYNPSPQTAYKPSY